MRYLDGAFFFLVFCLVIASLFSEREPLVIGLIHDFLR